MAQDNAFIDELMQLDETTVTNMFQEPTQQSSGNPNIYKTNPLKVSKDVSPDGHYHSKVRVLYNPKDKSKSIVNTAHYAFTDSEGFFMLDSKLAMGDRSCKIFKDWKSFHFNNDETQFEVDGKNYTKKSWADHMFDKGEERYCLVQVMEDANQPEAVGKFMIMKMPKVVFDIMNSKMNPTDKTKTKQDLMNYLFGPVLEMDVQPGPEDPQHPERRQREIKYTLCNFETDPTPITMVTGEPLFTEDEMDMITEYAEGKKVLSNPKATAKKVAEATAKCKELVPALKELMKKATDYVEENAIDIVAEVGYHEPSEAQWARYENWRHIVLDLMKDPATYIEATVTTPGKSDNNDEHENTKENAESRVMPTDESEDLPF